MSQYTQKNCLNCNELFMAATRDIKRGKGGKFCSRKCFTEHKIKNYIPKPPKEPNVTCALCNKPFYLRESRHEKSKSGLFFCCREHKDQAQRIGGIKEIMPPHYGTGEEDYRSKAFLHNEHKCNLCGYNKYPQVLEVHHKDVDRTNNSIENLQLLCPTCHKEKHFLSNTGPWHTGK